MSKRKKETFYIDLTNLSETESEDEDAKPKSLSKNDLASVVDWMDVSDSEDDWVESEKNVKSEDKTQERDSFLEFGLMNTYSKSDLSRDKVTKKEPTER